MVKKYLTWIPPTTEEGFTHVRIEKSVNNGVSYSEFTIANDPAWTANGILISSTSSVDLLGDSGHWYKIRFYDSVNDSYSDYSLPMRGSDFRGYCTITDIRNFTNAQTAEYSDAALQMMIDTVTASIDLDLNRSWQGVETVTDSYFDGNGRDYLFVDNDLQSITSLAIDNDGTGTFTAIDSSLYTVYADRGGIYLDPNADISKFPKGRKRVKISYTHGFADPTDSVRHLCVLMVANMMKMDNTRTVMIDKITAGLRVNGYENTEVGPCENSGY